MKEKVILTDCDGVLLNWEYAFSVWMEQHGYKTVIDARFMYDIGKRYDLDEKKKHSLIKRFNESAAIGFLPPLRDAIHYVRRLHEEHGYVFNVITSLSKDKNAQKLREMNLKKMFGESVFTDIVCLETGADKHEALEPYRDSNLWFIEDKVENAEVGHDMGIKSVIMEHAFNMRYKGLLPKVKNWAELYEMIVSDDLTDTTPY